MLIRRYLNGLALGVALATATLLGAAEQNPAASQPTVNGPLEPAAAIPHFQLPPGLQIELVAAEPAVTDPVEIRFDEAGRMWVVEMGDYPHGPPPGEAPQSRIRILEDRDGDGIYETSSIFADKLLFATGLQPWNGGVVVSLAGSITFLKDTDGDGRADKSEKWYEGFAQENSQLRANHPRWNLDGYIYVANGLRGGKVVDARRPERPPVALSNLDFRFQPFSGDFESITGVGQFGLTFDDWGNRFICSNRNPLMHVVIEDRFLKRNPGVALPELRQDVAAAGEQSRVFPLSRAWTTSNLHAGQFTAACGVHIYRGDRLPTPFYGAGFTCDPTGNLVHCEILEARGASYSSRPEREQVEFLATPDEWFRPVNCETGPDGALYIVDMYRAVIEHPDFVPDELKKRPDLMLGTDRGRIWRIVPAAAERPQQPAPIATLDTAGLVARLEQANAWQRETAARLLVERQDRTARDGLVKLATGGGAPAARVAALWTLRNLGLLGQELLLRALSDQSAEVREQGVALSESLGDEMPVRAAVQTRANDPAPRVRFRSALVLTPARDDADVQALARIAVSGSSDVWTRRAVTLAAGQRTLEVALRILRDAKDEELADLPSIQALFRELAQTPGPASLADHQEFIRLLGKRFGRDEQRRLLANVVDGWLGALARSGKRLEEVSADQKAAQQIQQLLSWATDVAQNAAQPDSLRAEVLDLLGANPSSQALVESLARAEPVQAVRVKAISLAARRAELSSWSGLLDEFGRSSPAVRRAILDGTLARSERTAVLLDEVAAGRVKLSELDQVTTSRLVKHGDAKIRERANQLLADAIPADRQKVLAEYQSVLAMNGDANRGRAIFAKNCSNCHRIGDLGVNVAPDISDSRVKTAPQILTDILQPNRAIDNNYISYAVVTTNGESLVGIIATETATSLSLKMPEGKSVTLLRSQIEEVRSLGVSLMPEGLEKSIPPQEMADLISFVKNWRYLDGKTPLGTTGP